MARRAASRAVGALRSDGSIQGRGGRAGGSGAEDARHVFDELLRRGRGASIYGLNRALADVARHSPAAAVSRYNRMARAGAGKVTPTVHTYAILIGCCCRADRLDLGFAALGNVVKKGFRVEAITFTPLLKGLCADKRTSDAMDIVLRRMTELSCMPDVFSCTILLKGLHCKEGRVIESEKLFDLMGTVAESGGGGGGCGGRGRWPRPWRGVPAASGAPPPGSAGCGGDGELRRRRETGEGHRQAGSQG
ncbi:hypothetical protein OsI_34184 [Oryza sativa Indica Group]|uniref:Uncharacterized protein n=1 Tax=Oryza sativa subsp. indica TaxID=39946 RepID=A2Z8Z1_ORYSI|nr:hypothetical protein OsI_34184 [Oryza sativa Indica Group]